MMAPFQPAPPPSNPFDHGAEAHVRELLGEWFELDCHEYTSTLAVPSGDRREELHRAWVDFFETNYRRNGEIAHTREYLLVAGVRR